jgi:hypothetical protein
LLVLLPPAAPHTYSRNKKYRVEMTSAERSQFTALLKRTALLQTHGPEQKSSGRGGARNKRQTVRQSAGAGLSSACAGRDRRSRARSRARATPSNQPTDQQRAQGGGGRTRVCGERAAPRRLGPPAAEPPLAAPRRYRDTQACARLRCNADRSQDSRLHRHSHRGVRSPSPGRIDRRLQTLPSRLPRLAL